MIKMPKRSENNVESGSDTLSDKNDNSNSSNSNTFRTAQSASGRISPLPLPTVKYSVHENVIKSISEHRKLIQYRRGEQPVIGLLIGEQKHKNIEITNAVALEGDSIQNIKIDSESIREFESFAKGFRQFTVGWYTTTSPSNEEITVHTQFCNIIGCPIILRLDFVGCEEKPKISMQTLVIRCVDDKPGSMFGDVTHMLDARGKNVSISKSVALDPVSGSSKQVSSSNVMTVATIPSLNVFLNRQTVYAMSTAFLGYSKEENLVVGGLVGTKKGKNINIFRSFKLVSMANDQEITIDKDKLKTVVECYTEENKDWMLLGWYNTRSRLTKQDIKAHKEICKFTQDSIMLQISLSQNKEAIIKVYGSATDTIDSKTETFLFKLPHTINSANLEKHRAIYEQYKRNQARTKISVYLLEMIQNVPDRLLKIHNTIFGKKKGYADK
ncbi:uncharacterized protein LOC116339835 [Contarinia nasturtii]|uniref:uncharacterized protein LOC116339835 n=1 Tax=Contarinia nasturtii TaxID=265458 RepID=UPI0012D40347|nr:uncharacterized protein LOC116339835 [Contarinia nasturtii]